ncbi:MULTISPECIES: hypothetical protein [unclassified Thioalkalivibrio]|uniref:hypothetical protein n=1 Tax=unclassified Thioalkalivibrio TaxID=2621013 RepID=UPI0003634CCC|nr:MULTISPECIES: hypothetical protein [unclassified Thioalkalivibrio]
MSEIQSHRAVGYALLAFPEVMASKRAVGYALLSPPGVVGSHRAVGYALLSRDVYDVGDVLTVTDHGEWTRDPQEFGYQWLRDGETIEGATDAEYTLTSADAGHEVSVRVIAKNPYGQGEAEAESNNIVAEAPQ